jgi:RNA polymerase primary sigma factor
MNSSALTGEETLARYVQDVARIPLLPRAEEARLARLAAAGDAAARRRLVEAHLRLVVALARRYRGQGLDLPDLIQEGNLGLMAAAERHDGRADLRFATVAAWWIRRAIRRGIATKGPIVRVPIRVAEGTLELGRAEERLTQELGRPPTRAEIARDAGVDEAVVDDLRRARERHVSLSAPAGEDAELGELIGDDGAADPAVRLAEAAEGDALREALAGLDARRRRVLELRYGVNGAEPRTLDAVARELGISRERARAIEAGALRELSARSRGALALAA